jgi:hypothetical protein
MDDPFASFTEDEKRAAEADGLQAAPDNASRTRNALELWDAAIPVRESDLARSYWASRGLEEPDDAACACLRFHPSCPFGQVRRPCILALFRNIVTDAPQAIHRIGLNPDGTKIDRMMLGPTAGAAVKLDPAGTGLAIGEGIETVLAGRQMGLRPAWAMGSAGSIAALPVLPGVATIAFMEENDGGASRNAIITCSRRWVDAGRKAISNRPRVGKDMNDLVRARKDTGSTVDISYTTEDLAEPLKNGGAPPHGEDPQADAPSIDRSDGTSDSWPPPAPIVSTLPAVEPFVPELLPAVIGDYVLDVADRQQAPPDFAAVAALCGLAACLGNKVRIRPKQNDDWEVVPNLWGAIIGRPSAMKSPAMKSALGPVYQIEADMRDAWEGGLKDKAVEDALAAITQRDSKKRAEKAFRSGDRNQARSLLEGMGQEQEEAPPCPRLVVNDATVEKLGELLNENPHGLLLTRDELAGFLARMESEEYQSDRAFYLEAFNGDGKFTYDRIGRGTVHIEQCTLSLIGGVQPTRIAPLVRAALGGTNNDGLIQRLQLAVYPDDIGSWEWIDRSPDLRARLAYEDAFKTLHGLDLDGAIMRFTSDAQAMFRAWMTETQAEARSGNLSSVLESHILKMPRTIASLALIFELLEGGRAAVGEAATRRALGWADYLRSHANRLYAAGDTMVENGAKLIVERRHLLPALFTGRDIQRKAWAGLGDRDAIQAAIDMLVDTHHCRSMPTKIGPSGGRPSDIFQWNPMLKGEA